MQILLQTQILHIPFHASQCELHSNLKASCLLRPFPPLHCIAVSKSDCTRLFSVSFPFHSLTSRLLTPNTWLVEIVIRHFFCFWSVALCAVILHELLHVLTAEISTHFRPGMEAATTWSWKKTFTFWLTTLYAVIRSSAVLPPWGSSVCPLQAVGCHWAGTHQPLEDASVCKNTVTAAHLWSCHDSRCWRGCSESMWQKLIASCKMLLLWPLCQHKSKVINDFQEGWAQEQLVGWAELHFSAFPPLPLLEGDWAKSGDEQCQLCRPDGTGLCCSFLVDTQLVSWGKRARMSQRRSDSSGNPKEAGALGTSGPEA